jgi:hypothetical protein
MEQQPLPGEPYGRHCLANPSRRTLATGKKERRDDETEEEMEGGVQEDEEVVHLQSVVELAAGTAREKATAAASPSAVGKRECCPSVRWCGSKLEWIEVDWGGPKTNTEVAKCSFWASRRVRPQVGWNSLVAGIRPVSTSFLLFPNEA